MRSPLQARRAPLAIVLGLVALISACNKAQPLPDPPLITDTFTGVLNVLGTSTQSFTVQYALQISDASVTVTSLKLASTNADITTTIGVGFGAFTNFDGSCARAPNFTATAANLNQELVAREQFRGEGVFCVQIFDSGTLTEPINYTMVVKHY